MSKNSAPHGLEKIEQHEKDIARQRFADKKLSKKVKYTNNSDHRQIERSSGLHCWIADNEKKRGPKI